MRRAFNIIRVVLAVVQMAVGVIVLWLFLTADRDRPRRKDGRRRRPSDEA